MKRSRQQVMSADRPKYWTGYTVYVQLCAVATVANWAFLATATDFIRSLWTNVSD